MKKLIYGQNILNVEDNVTTEQAKAKLAQFYPEVANATAAVNAGTGDITFTVTSGSKGAKKLIYGQNILNVEDTVTPEQAKAKLAQFYPEVANATPAVAANGDITFTVTSGSKGAKKLIYGQNILNVEDNVTSEQAKAKLAQFYPEVANATAAVADNGDITFTVTSGSKGAKKLIYGQNILNVEDSVTSEQAKAKLAQFYPEVANATAAVAANGDITFTVTSGSKGTVI